MKNRLWSAGIAGALLLSFSSILPAQTPPPTPSTNASSADDRDWYKYSFGVFGGVEFWHNETSNHGQSTTTSGFIPVGGRTNSFAPGYAGGVRADQDFLRYIGVEEGWTIFAQNNLRLYPQQPNATQNYGIGARNGQVYIAPLLYLTPPSSRVRPFFMAGPAFQYWWVTRNGINEGNSIGAPRLQGRNDVALVFGGGVKFRVGERFVLRTDAHGTWTLNPHFNLTAQPGGPGSIYIPEHGTQLGLQASVGMDFMFGKVSRPAPPAPPPPPPPPAPKELNVSVSASPASVCPGDTVQVTANAANAPDAATYQWTVNGEATSQARTLSFGTNGRAAGSYTIGLTIAAPGFNNGTASTTVTVRAYVPPSGNVSASPAEIYVGDSSTVNANFTNQCDGPVQPPVCTASEGTMSGMTYNSTGVQFDASVSGEQQKTITISCTAKDDRSSGSASTTIVVKKKANLEAVRLPDIVFARNNARVNNCGKRVLLEELKTYLDKDPTGRVVFVGHEDRGELRKLRLDEKRAINAAAIISAGQGICLNFNASQIMIQAAGENQGSDDFKPYFCETSVKERGGNAVNSADKRAQYRRVEVWFVPTNGNMPASASSAKDAPSMGVSKVGCPK